jgi:urease accessory protein
MLRVEKYAVQNAHSVAGIRRLSVPFEIRQKSRFRAVLEDGTELAIFLPRGSKLIDGDLLEADDGTLIRVVAAAEQLLYVTAPSSLALTRAAYHLGNRHTPVEIGNGFLKLANDPVLREMLQGLGVQLREVHLPFQPESGAYGKGHGHHSDEEGERELAQERFHAHYSSRHSGDAPASERHDQDESRTPGHS